MIKDLADEEVEFNPHYPVRNYSKMEICKHMNFTLIVNNGKIFFKCKCSYTLGENSEGIQEQLQNIIGVLSETKNGLQTKALITGKI